MTSPTQQKSMPVPAILVYGTPTSPELTQASWFRAEDKQAAKAAAEVVKFSVIDIQTEAEKALTIGVHEGVLKGSGRMIVSSVSSEVYRRIENYVARVAGAEASTSPTNSEPASTKALPEQNMNSACRRRHFFGSRSRIHQQARKPQCLAAQSLGNASGRRAGARGLLEREA